MELSAKEIMAKLQEPFHPDDVEWRVGATSTDKKTGIALAYITIQCIQNRLDDVFGPFGWKNEYKEWKGTAQLCGISIKFDGEWITKWDGAGDANTEAIKGGLSDSMKRAAYQWGIGRYLHKLPTIWAKIKPAGKSYVLDGKVSLPAWALPQGHVELPIPPAKKPNPSASVVLTIVNDAKKIPAAIDDAKCNILFTKANKMGLSVEDIHLLAKMKFNIESVKELAISQFADLNNNMQKYWTEIVVEKSKAV